MSKRITLISYIDEVETKKIESIIGKYKEITCKVPFGINDEKRYEIDNLPYHFTIFATNKENEKQIIKIAQKLNSDRIKVKINDIRIMNARYDSYCLYFSIEENKEIKELQRIFYNEFPKEKYNPDDFTFHMTIDIDKNYNKIIEIQNSLKENFVPFFLQFDTLALFDYPGDMIEKFSIKKEI